MTPVNSEASVEERLTKVEAYYEVISKRIDDLRSDINQRFEEFRTGIGIDKRFEELRSDMDHRFEAIDKRFEAIDKRFDDINKRFSLLTWTITGWFTLLTLLIVLFKFIKF